MSGGLCTCLRLYHFLAVRSGPRVFSAAMGLTVLLHERGESRVPCSAAVRAGGHLQSWGTGRAEVLESDSDYAQHHLCGLPGGLWEGAGKAI